MLLMEWCFYSFTISWRRCLRSQKSIYPDKSIHIWSCIVHHCLYQSNDGPKGEHPVSIGTRQDCLNLRLSIFEIMTKHQCLTCTSSHFMRQISKPFKIRLILRKDMCSLPEPLFGWKQSHNDFLRKEKIRWPVSRVDGERRRGKREHRMKMKLLVNCIY